MYSVRYDNGTYKVEDFHTDRITISVTKLYVGQSTRGHYHPNDEVYYIVQGEGSLLLGEEIINLNPDKFIYIPCNAVHKVVNTGKTTLMFVCAWIGG